MSTHPKRFGVVLRDLLIHREMTTKLGNPQWSELARRLPTMHYETLRKAVSGERDPSPRLMEECAEALGLRPQVFFEYRLWRAQQSLNVDSAGVHTVLRALDALEEFVADSNDTPTGCNA